MCSKYDRRAVCIKWYSAPDGRRSYKPTWRDEFSCHIPDWVYNDMYIPLKKQKQKEINIELDALQKNLEKRKLKVQGIQNEELEEPDE